jgi:hypothetical protein
MTLPSATAIASSPELAEAPAAPDIPRMRESISVMIRRGPFWRLDLSARVTAS